MKLISLILAVLVAGIAYFGDEIVFRSRFSVNPIFRAVLDNTIHALIGCVSSMLFFSYDTTPFSDGMVFYVILCTSVSSLIDVDHIFAAKSILWRDISLSKRQGILHCTTGTLAIILIFLIYSYYRKKVSYILTNYILIIAFLSHQIRDANRRGLWILPFGHTAPLSVPVYIASIVILPTPLWYIFSYTRPTFKYVPLVSVNV